MPCLFREMKLGVPNMNNCFFLFFFFRQTSSADSSCGGGGGGGDRCVVSLALGLLLGSAKKDTDRNTVNLVQLQEANHA